MAVPPNPLNTRSAYSNIQSTELGDVNPLAGSPPLLREFGVANPFPDSRMEQNGRAIDEPISSQNPYLDRLIRLYENGRLPPDVMRELGPVIDAMAGNGFYGRGRMVYPGDTDSRNPVSNYQRTPQEHIRPALPSRGRGY